MASSIKGITVKLGADTTALSTALKDVDKESRSLQTELKTVERLYTSIVDVSMPYENYKYFKIFAFSNLFTC